LMTSGGLGSPSAALVAAMCVVTYLAAT